MLRIAAAAVVFGVFDFVLRPVGGMLHVTWAMRSSVAYLHELLSVF